MGWQSDVPQCRFAVPGADEWLKGPELNGKYREIKNDNKDLYKGRGRS